MVLEQSKMHSELQRLNTFGCFAERIRKLTQVLSQRLRIYLVGKDGDGIRRNTFYFHPYVIYTSCVVLGNSYLSFSTICLFLCRLEKLFSQPTLQGSYGD